MAVIGEARPLADSEIRHPGEPRPFRPVRRKARPPPLGMEQRRLPEVLGTPEPEPRAAENAEAFGQEWLGHQPGKGPHPVAHGNVGDARGKVDRLVRCMQPEIESGAALAEGAERRQQASGGEERGRGQRHRAAPVTRRKRADGALEGVEALAQHRIELEPRRGERDAPDLAHEQGKPQRVLEEPDLVADRGRRHRQFGSRRSKAQMPRRRLEGAQGRQRRQAAMPQDR